MDKIFVSELIALTLSAMKTDLKLSDGIVYRYECHGLRPMQRYFDGKDHAYYSGELADAFVDDYYVLYESGNISDRKFRYIRKSSALVKEYADTKALQWKQLAAWKRRTLASPFFQGVLDDFLEYHVQEGRYSKSTLYGYGLKAFEFLTYLEQGGHSDFSRLDIMAVTGYIPYLSTKYPNSIKGMMTALRCFLSYLFQHGFVGEDMRNTMEVTAARQRRILPRFTEQEVCTILSIPDRNSTKGKRDYAMMLLAKATGLRSVDILNLCLHDIDWRRNEFHIIQRKTGNPLCLPLTPEVGNAIADYVLHGRPNSEQPYVFLRIKAPYEKIKSSTALCHVVETCMRVSGIEHIPGEWKNVHSFRRYAATKMLEAEIPVTTIAQVLGQHDPDSTKPYIAVSLDKLRECALDLHGIMLKEGSL